MFYKFHLTKWVISSVFSNTVPKLKFKNPETKKLKNWSISCAVIQGRYKIELYFQHPYKTNKTH